MNLRNADTSVVQAFVAKKTRNSKRKLATNYFFHWPRDATSGLGREIITGGIAYQLASPLDPYGCLSGVVAHEVAVIWLKFGKYFIWFLYAAPSGK